MCRAGGLHVQCAQSAFYQPCLYMHIFSSFSKIVVAHVLAAWHIHWRIDEWMDDSVGGLNKLK